MKTILTIFVFITLQTTALFSTNISILQYQDIKVTHKYEDKSKNIIIQRKQDPKCLELGINYDTVFSGDMANKEVPSQCKKIFVTTLGTIQPIQMLDIKTVAELEVLDLIKKSISKPNNYVLIDSRRSNWYENSTIPTAVNLPYNTISYDEDFPEDFQKVLDTLNIKKTQDGQFDFSQAKEAILFCNGNWCVQSPRAIKELLSIGYPKKKLMWYRGGLQDWYILGFSTIRGDLK